MKTKQLSVVLLFSIFALQHVQANILIITRGPVCSGLGSYLANAIISHDNSYMFVSQNEISKNLYYTLLSALFPEQMTILRTAIHPENISYAITNYFLYFKDTAYEAQKQAAKKAIYEIQEFLNDPRNEQIHTLHRTTLKHVVMAELAFHATCGHNVIWETGTMVSWEDGLDTIKNSFENVLEVFTYSPPTTMLTEWQQRNERAHAMCNASERRLMKHVLTTFFNCFEPTTDDELPSIILTKNDFEKIIAQATNYIETVLEHEQGADGTYTKTEFTFQELFNFTDELYQNFDFDIQDQVTLTPTIQYDVALSSKQECLKFAQQFFDR